ncbi:hypothetical protein ACIQNG_25560 [Streptomyces sp. NPDC091377]|uniref:hypothetical protein n=1 Tax=Streptomyces sp. NPDC091377 TaxID=3365995 RepID=UPI0037F57612
MADHDDDQAEMMEALAHGISLAYTILVDVCANLPVPIGMPTERQVTAVEALPAIRRAAELASDQPMSELQEARLFTGCIHLLAAVDLYRLCLGQYEETRAHGVGINLTHAEEALKDLARWLMTIQPD